jgi:DNA-binding PadR family transcriptional regulator
MHQEDDWPGRGGRQGHRRGDHGEWSERAERPERGGPWGPPMRGRARGGSSRHGPGWLGRGFWPGDERMRGPRVRRGDVRAAALALLAEEPRNGYQIIQELSERSGGVWRPSPGSVYPALQQLEDEGLIRAEELDGGRRGFVLTDEGRSYVDSHVAELEAPWEVVAGRERGSLREMRGLVGQLAMAAMQVTNAGSDAQIAEAQRILIETRRRLYRILAADDESGEPPAGEGEAG